MSNPEESRLNDVDIDSVMSLAGKIQQEPQVADTRWSAQVKWKGGFRSEAKIRDFEPSASDEPQQLGGTDTGPNPVEQVLAALGNCLAVGYAANATAAGIEISDLSIDLEGDIDLHTFLGLSEGNAGYNGISVKVKIDSDASQEQLEALHQKVVSTSPVGHTLSRAVNVNVDLS
jgi:uncharacterized OsmC-like protein